MVKKCGSYIHPVTKIFLSFRVFMKARKKKISTKNRKMSQTMKTFFLPPFNKDFPRDFPLILTDAILINFHL